MPFSMLLHEGCQAGYHHTDRALLSMFTLALLKAPFAFTPLRLLYCRLIRPPQVVNIAACCFAFSCQRDASAKLDTPCRHIIDALMPCREQSRLHRQHITRCHIAIRYALLPFRMLLFFFSLCRSHVYPPLITIILPPLFDATDAAAADTIFATSY